MFCRNTVEISENSENHRRAVVCGLYLVELEMVMGRAGKVVEKTQGELKAAKSGEREWQSGLGSANYIDLRVVPSFSPKNSLGTDTKNARMGHPSPG
jgi:hypothetical protein